MNPLKVDRTRLHKLTDLPNVGKASAHDLELLGIRVPAQLVGRDPYALYDELCEKTHAVHDPCVMDLFLSITRFMQGDDPKPWWAYTEERKREMESRRKG